MFTSVLSPLTTSQFLLLVGLERVPVVLPLPVGDRGGRAGGADGTAGGGAGAGTALTGL